MTDNRRSWLWRRKSSEHSPGETESSGSISSLSERFSDDQPCPTHTSHSPEVTSKAVPIIDQQLNNDVNTLTEKLSAALLNITAKEDLVNQHSKVAEEAVSGWEKAENEVLLLKKQLEAVTQKNSALEDRIGHLDGALKECVRQLRQSREEQEQRIHGAVAKKTREWEHTKSELENQLLDLQKKLQTTENEAAATVDLDLHSKLEDAEKQNSALKLELLSRLEELEIRIIERDLSTQAAETASRQHLESIKKLAKLEAECRRLKSVARKASTTSDHKSFVASMYVESFTDSQSDSGERLLAVETDTHKMSGFETNECNPSHSNSWASSLVTELDQFKNEKVVGRNFMVPSVNINIMDDFLEMERLAGLPDTGSRGYCYKVGPVSDNCDAGESSIKAELEAMVHRTAELEEKLEKVEAEKVEQEMALTDSRKQLEMSQAQLNEAELKLVELQTQLALAKNAKQALEVEIKAAKATKEVAESRLRVVEAEMKTQLALASKSKQVVEEEVKTAKATKEAAESRLRVVKAEMKTQLALASKSKQVVEEEVKTANATKEAAESRLRVVEAEMKSLHSKIESLEEEIVTERALSEENFMLCQKFKDELLKMKHEAELQLLRSSTGELKIKQEKELEVAASKFAECQKTIASLGRQLRSLATLDDFLMDSEKPLELSGEGLQRAKNGGETRNLHSGESYISHNRDSETSKILIAI